MTRRAQRVAALGACCLLLAPAAVRAATVRRLFEPTDMELEEPGMAELDMQFGLVRGQDAYRLSVPDFELDLGLTNNIELDIDGEFAIGGPNSGAFSFNQVAPDNLWTAVKLGFLDLADPDSDVSWTTGMQIGPKFPVARGAQGVGVEGLLLLGCRIHQTHIVLNLGGLYDPGGGGGAPRPSGPEYGIDFDQPLDAAGRWSLTAGVSGATYTSPDPDQFTTTAGITWSPFDNLDLSIVGLRGWLSGGDQYGVLFGISPKFRLW